MTVTTGGSRTCPHKYPDGAYGYLYYHNKRPIPASEALVREEYVRIIDKDAHGQVIWRCCQCNYETWNDEDDFNCRSCEHSPCDICFIRQKSKGDLVYFLLGVVRRDLFEQHLITDVSVHEFNSNDTSATESTERNGDVPVEISTIVTEASKEQLGFSDLAVPNRFHPHHDGFISPEDDVFRPDMNLSIRTLFSPLASVFAISPEFSPGETAKQWLHDWVKEKKELQMNGEIEKKFDEIFSPSQTAHIDQANKMQRASARLEVISEEDDQYSAALAGEPVLPQYSFDTKWLREAGVTSQRPAPANNLTCDVHPLFAFHHWPDCRQELWTWMRPALRIASMCLAKPSCMTFWIQLFHGVRSQIVRPGLKDRQDCATWYIQPVRLISDEDNHARAVEAIEKLRELGEDWTWMNWSWSRRPARLSDDELNPELDETATKLTGPLICRRHQSVLEDEPDIGETPTFPTGVEGSGTMRQNVHIKLEDDFLKFIEQATTDPNITGNQILCFNLHFASVILHNLAHAIEQFLTYGFYQSRNLVRMQEPCMHPFQVAECGDHYLQDLMQGVCEPLAGDYMYSRGLYLIDTTSFYRGDNSIASHDALAIPISVVSSFQQQSYWNNLEVNGFTGFVVEEGWPRALKARYVAPCQWGDMMADADLYYVPPKEDQDKTKDNQDSTTNLMNNVVRQAVEQALPTDDADAPPINATTYVELSSSEREQLRTMAKPYWDAIMNELMETNKPLAEIDMAIALTEDEGAKSALEKTRSRMAARLNTRIKSCAASYRLTLQVTLSVVLRDRSTRKPGDEVEPGSLTTEDKRMIEVLAPTVEVISERLEHALRKLSPRTIATDMVKAQRETIEAEVVLSSGRSSEYSNDRLPLQIATNADDEFSDAPPEVSSPDRAAYDEPSS